MRHSYNTEATAVGHPEHAPGGYNKHGDAGYAQDAPGAPDAGAYRYDEASATNPYTGGYNQQPGAQEMPTNYQYGDGVYERPARPTF